ncbi:MAG: cysteine hydrolase [Chloroflexi bacterium]|nr:cysteine hydrolase [Chloroflexota bacterium]
MADTKMNPKTTALIVNKMQNDWITFKQDNLVKVMEQNNVIPNIRRLMAACRAAGIPVISVGHLKRPDGQDQFAYESDNKDHIKFLQEGEPGAEFMEALKPLPNEHVVWSRRYSGFFNTDLELRLKCLRIDTLILTGVLTNVSVAITVFDAFNRDLDTIVVKDGCGANTHELNDFFMAKVFPVSSQVRTTEEILAAIGAGAK